jgi:hypothetical protein
MPPTVVTDFLSARRFDIRFENAGDRQIAPLRVSISPDVETVTAGDGRVIPSTLPSFAKPAKDLCQYQRDSEGNDDLDAFDSFGVELPSAPDLKFICISLAWPKPSQRVQENQRACWPTASDSVFVNSLIDPGQARDYRCSKLVVACEKGIEGAAKMSALAA